MSEEIRAEMVANVLSVLVGVGEQVPAGQPVVILESMKMEIPVTTEDGGTVSEILVSEGDEIDTGAVIARLS